MKSWITCSLRDAAWAPIAVLLSSVILGNIFNIYSLFPGIDKTVHIGGGMAVTYFFAISIHHSQKLVGRIQGDWQLFFSLALTFIVALAWEGIEVLGDVTLGSKMNHGLTDTLLDILFGLLGSLIVLFFRAGTASSGLRQDATDHPGS